MILPILKYKDIHMRVSIKKLADKGLVIKYGEGGYKMGGRQGKFYPYKKKRGWKQIKF